MNWPNDCVFVFFWYEYAMNSENKSRINEREKNHTNKKAEEKKCVANQRSKHANQVNRTECMERERAHPGTTF